MSSSFDNVIVGGGPAGSMLALRLAAAGREVILLEKQRGPHHKVCGEFLSAEALGYLKRIGIDAQALGAKPIQYIRLHTGRKSIHAALPFPALSLSRRVLDEALLERAQSVGCDVRRGVFVEKLLPGSGGFSIRLRDNQVIRTNNVFLATGKHDLTDRPRNRGAQPDLVGFKMHCQLTPESTENIRQTMELFLFRDGYGGLALVENDRVNLCFVIHQRRMRELGAGWTALVAAIHSECPAIARILREPTPCWPKPLAISPIPYGYIAGNSNGIWRVGDQAAVIPSFTGDGISIALHSAELASEMFLCGETPDAYLACLQTHLKSGMSFATTLSRIMVTTTGRLLAPAVLSALPGALSWIAEHTRIPARVLRAADLTRSAPTAHMPVSAA